MLDLLQKDYGMDSIWVLTLRHFEAGGFSEIMSQPRMQQLGRRCPRPLTRGRGKEDDKLGIVV